MSQFIENPARGSDHFAADFPRSALLRRSG